MSLSKYHQKYADLPDEELEKRARVKEEELQNIFSVIPFPKTGTPVRVGVMGCGDKRFVQYHQEIFSRLFVKPAAITTFDISTEHLTGADNVYLHDVTLPLPSGPFDVTYAHVLLKFIETEKQWDVIQNSFDALANGGITIHVFDHEEVETADVLLSNGQYAVPLERWKTQLQERGIENHTVPLQYGCALILKK
jgi:hypothetical protein